MSEINVLILNSDKLLQKSFHELLSRCGYRTDIADSVEKSLAYLEDNTYHLVIADIDKSGGIELLKIMKKNSHPAEVIMISSHVNMDVARSSLEMGAFDYLLKPVEDDKIISAIKKAVSAKAEGVSAMPKPSLLDKILHKDGIYHGLVGTSQSMNDIYSMIERIATSKATVLLRGESGTGKRMIARAIHAADKKRRDMPFIEISCGALPREIIESELFGHTKGSFTGAIADRKGRFELADGGTILLDDIDAFSLDLQVKLLRVLQHKEFERVGDHKTMKIDTRIIVSTNQNLEKALTDKKFREDLYYRLNVISITLPPLRERKDDLPLLIDHFVKFYSKENYKKTKELTPAARQVLNNHDWPGNIRELENIIERAVILDVDGAIDTDDLPEILISKNVSVTATLPAKIRADDSSSLRDMMKEPEKIYILRILHEVGWNKKRAATRLGVNRTTLYNKLRQYNILAPDEK